MSSLPAQPLYASNPHTSGPLQSQERLPSIRDFLYDSSQSSNARQRPQQPPQEQNNNSNLAPNYPPRNRPPPPTWSPSEASNGLYQASPMISPYSPATTTATSYRHHPPQSVPSPQPQQMHNKHDVSYAMPPPSHPSMSVLNTPHLHARDEVLAGSGPMQGSGAPPATHARQQAPRRPDSRASIGASSPMSTRSPHVSIKSISSCLEGPNLTDYLYSP